MFYQCKLIDVNSIYGENRIRNPEPGDMYYAPWIEDYTAEFGLSNTYIKQCQGKRPPIFIVLPNGSVFCPDQRSRSGIEWILEGEIPNISVKQFIMVDDCKWWLRDGVLSDELS